MDAIINFSLQARVNQQAEPAHRSTLFHHKAVVSFTYCGQLRIPLQNLARAFRLKLVKLLTPGYSRIPQPRPKRRKALVPVREAISCVRKDWWSRSTHRGTWGKKTQLSPGEKSAFSLLNGHYSMTAYEILRLEKLERNI